MPITIDYESDWQGRLRARIYWQFRGKPKIQAWVDMVARQFQDLEDAYQALATMSSIDDSTAAQLDNLGRFVGQPRGGVDDTTYRLYLRARIVANKSGGRPEDIYKVFGLLFPTATLYLRSGGTKSFFLRVTGQVLTRVQALVGGQFLLDSKEAGARANLIWQESPTPSMFRFDSGPGLDVGHLAGAL